VEATPLPQDIKQLLLKDVAPAAGAAG